MNTPMKYQTAKPIHFKLKGSEYSEKFLQKYIFDDPTCLNLGELRPIERERRQSSGGRLDLLLKDDESDTFYEVEVMLGKTDESHIIRTIEYWDLERKKNPHYNHIAVIAAEDITNRFFNVIGLLSNNIPIIAIKINSLISNDKLIIDFIKILDLYEAPDMDDMDEVNEETRDETYWQKKSSKDIFDMYKKMVDLCRENGLNAKTKYNKHYIAFANDKNDFWNFCILLPRKTKKFCQVRMLVGEDNIQEAEDILNETNIDFEVGKRRNKIIMKLNSELLKSEEEKVVKILDMAYKSCSSKN